MVFSIQSVPAVYEVKVPFVVTCYAFQWARDAGVQSYQLLGEERTLKKKNKSKNWERKITYLKPYFR